MKNCTKCGGNDTRISRYQSQNGLMPSFKAWYRCNECNARFESLSLSKTIKNVAGSAVVLSFVGILLVASPESQQLNQTAGSPETKQTVDVSKVVADLQSPEKSADARYRTGLNLLISQWDDSFVSEGENEKVFEAVQLIQQAAEQDHAEAQLVMGILHEQGRGVLQDYEIATRWYESASDKGNPNAMVRLGLMARDGVSSDKNLGEAYVWLNIAASRGVTFAEMMRNKVASEMSKDELAEAQRLSRISDGLYPHVAYLKSPLPLDF